MKISEEDYFEFDTGKRVYAYRNKIGLGPDLSVTGGYDDGFYGEGWDYSDETHGLTVAEHIELADYMIEQWTKYKNEAEESRV